MALVGWISSRGSVIFFGLSAMNQIGIRPLVNSHFEMIILGYGSDWQASENMSSATIRVGNTDTIIMDLLPNIHPGEVLQEEFLAELNLTAYRLAQDVCIPQTRLSEILKGKRRITADTALRFARYFGNSPKFWLGLQNDYDLEETQRNHAADLERIRSFASRAAA